MYIPLVREAVEIEGRSGVFYVVRADYRHGVADVILRHGHGKEIQNVPFDSLRSSRRALGGMSRNLADPRLNCNTC